MENLHQTTTGGLTRGKEVRKEKVWLKRWIGDSTREIEILVDIYIY